MDTAQPITLSNNSSFANWKDTEFAKDSGVATFAQAIQLGLRETTDALKELTRAAASAALLPTTIQGTPRHNDLVAALTKLAP